jgi:catechol 2,3-dioxygenase-like lactoylglutathione lyase family enzyme
VAIPGLTGWWGAVLDSPDPHALAGFYAALLGWEPGTGEPGWATLRQPGRDCYLGFHVNPSYVPPVWPPEEGAQQMMLHLDLEVADIAAAAEAAVALGARLAGHQPQENVRVLLDPDGHPFCLYAGG